MKSEAIEEARNGSAIQKAHSSAYKALACELDGLSEWRRISCTMTCEIHENEVGWMRIPGLNAGVQCTSTIPASLDATLASAHATTLDSTLDATAILRP